MASQLNPAEARRASSLAKGWPTATEIAARLGISSSNGSQWAREKRDEGKLLGVWCEQERTFRYPDFQFDHVGQLRTEVGQLLATMAKKPGWTMTEDPSGWQRTFWLYQPLRSLSRRVIAFRTGKLGPIPSDPEAAADFLRAHATPSSPDEAAARSPAGAFMSDPGAVLPLFVRTSRRTAPLGWALLHRRTIEHRRPKPNNRAETSHLKRCVSPALSSSIPLR